MGIISVTNTHTNMTDEFTSVGRAMAYYGGVAWRIACAEGSDEHLQGWRGTETLHNEQPDLILVIE